MAIALGALAFVVDLPHYRFGLRHMVTVAAAAGVAVGALPVMASAVGGRWRMPTTDDASLLSWMPADRATPSEDAGARDVAAGYFPHACVELARCYAMSAESSGVRALVDAGSVTREACDAQFLDDLRAEATSASEPFV
jgi:hypothetical protein